MSLVLTSAKYDLLETVRIPIAVVGSAFFPAVSMLFFVVPFTGEDPVVSTFAAASMVVFSVMTSNLFRYGIGVAEDRAQPWDPYTRTLPAGPFPRFAGRLLSGLALMLVSLVPVVLIAAFLTAATITLPQGVLALGAVFLAALPFALMGFAIGYWLPSKAALVVCQIIFLPMAFGGGLLTPPGTAPGFIETIAPFLPTRGAAELMWAAVGDYTINPLSVVMLAVWTVAMAALATWAYRRDEGRRFS